MPPPPPPPSPPPPHRSPPPTPPRPQRGYPHNFIWHDRPFVSWPEQLSQLATHRANQGSTGTSTTLRDEQQVGSRVTEQQQQVPAPASSPHQRQPRHGSRWSPEEERLLLASVRQRGASGPWSAIAADVKGAGGPLRSTQAIRDKYYGLIASSMSNSAVGSHPTTSVSSRYQTQAALVTPDGLTTPSSAPELSSRGYAWSAAQDALLLKAVEQHGQDWRLVAIRINAAGGPFRTGAAARVRYFRITTSSVAEAHAAFTASASQASANAIATTSSTSALAAPSESSTPRPATSQTQQALPIEALLANPAGPSTTQAAPRGDNQAKQP